MVKGNLKVNYAGSVFTFMPVFLLVILFVFTALAPSFSESEENTSKPDEQLIEEIKREYDAFDTALEAKDLEKIMSYYHKDYLHDGRTKEDEEKNFKGLFDIAQNIEVSREIEKVEISDDKITVADSGQMDVVGKDSGEVIVIKWEKWVMVIIKTEDGYRAYGNHKISGTEDQEKDDKAETPK